VKFFFACLPSLHKAESFKWVKSTF
jgi:hypothetical protein